MGRNLDLSKFGKPGTILVLNQTKFDDNYVEPRVGTEKDVDSLKRVFRDELKFTWEQADDLTVAQIHQKVKEYAKKDYFNVGALVIVVLTHGRESGDLCAKDGTYNFIHIFDPIRLCKPLHNKLKWFIIQACRSGDSDKYEQRVKLPIDPRTARVPINLSRGHEQESIHKALSGTINTVISFSTVEGRISTRSKEEGSIMIQTLCNQLETSALAHESLLSMLCHVNRTVCSMTFEDENKTFGQTPSFLSSLIQDVLFPKLSRDQLVGCGSFPSSSSQLSKPLEREDCQASPEQQMENLVTKQDGKLVKKANFGKVDSYPLDEKYKYAGRAYIFHDNDCRKDSIKQIETLTRDTLKLTPIEKRVDGTSGAIQELKQVALNNNFHQEACFFAFVLVNFDWRNFNHGVPDLIRAFFATSCTTLASKPKIFIFVDTRRRIPEGPELQSDYFEELGYANQHSDMLFVNSFNTQFLSSLIKTLDSPRDIVTLITDAIGDSSEDIKHPRFDTKYFYIPEECTPGNYFQEYMDIALYKQQRVRVKIPISATIIDSTLRFPFFCIGNFELYIPPAEINSINFVGLEFGISDPTQHFVGRIEELKQLANHFSLNASHVKEQLISKHSLRLDVEAGCFSTADVEEEQAKVTEVVEEQASNTLTSNIDVDVAITGVQGIGKSQIVLRFIQIYSKDFKSFVVIDTENIEESFNRLMSNAKTETVPGLYDYLKDKGNSLFVFENFNENIENISDYLPPSNVANFSVIVVSRNVDFPNAKFELKVSSMRDTDAKKLADKLHRGIDSTELTKFGKHPLALEIVCNYYKHCTDVDDLFRETPQSLADVLQNLETVDDLPTIKISRYNGECNTDNIEWRNIKDLVNRLP